MKPLPIVVVILLAAVACIATEKARFDNYKVYTLNVSTVEQLDQLRTLEEENRYQFWSLTLGASSIIIAPHQAADYVDLVAGLKLGSQLKIANLQQ